MAFNGSGTFVRLYNWATDRANSVKIMAARMDAEDDGFATGLSTCITKNGETTTTARIPFTLGISLGTGSVSSPALCFTTDGNTGIYSIGADNIGIAAGGSKIVDIATTGVSVVGTFATSGALTVTANAAQALAVGANGATNPALEVATNATSAVTGVRISAAASGSGAFIIVIGGGTDEDLYLDAKGGGDLHLNATGTGYVYAHRTLSLDVDLIVAGVGYFADGTVGAPGISFNSDADTGLYRIGANNLGVSVAGTKTIDIFSTAVDFAVAIRPTSNDGAALGSATRSWSDVFVASGAVLNFANGDVTITHSSGVLTVNTGTILALPSAGVKLNGIFALRETYFGGSGGTGYRVIRVGNTTNGENIALGVDPSAVISTGYAGDGQILLPNKGLLAPNGNAWVGVLLSTGGALYLGPVTTGSEVSTSGNVKIDSVGNLIVQVATASTSTASGSGQFAGGVGIAGALYVGGNATFTAGNVAISAGTLTVTNNAGAHVLSANNSASHHLRFLIGGTVRLYLGVATSAGDVISGSSNQDIIICGNSNNIVFSVDNGTSISATILGSGQLSLNSASSTSPCTTYSLSSAIKMYVGVAAAANGIISTSATNDGVIAVNTANFLVSIDNGSSVAFKIAKTTGVVTVNATTASTTSTTGALVVGGGVGVAGAIFTGGAVSVGSTTASTSTTTGALIVGGGAGIAGAVYIGGALSAAAGGAFSGTFSGAHTYSGAISITDSTASTSITTGALKVTGGLGVQGDAYVSSVYSKGAASSAMLGVRGTYMGYSSSYRVMQLGSFVDAYLVAIGVDPVTNNGSAFLGNSTEILLPYTARFLVSNSSANSGAGTTGSNWITALSFGASGGIILGNPTGGDKGVGTLNAAGDIYKNNTAYTNPDYVFEHYFTGRIERFAANEGAQKYGGLRSLQELKDHVRQHLRFPGITNQPMGMFARGDFVLERLEETTLYIFELEERLRRLEAR